MVWSPARLSLKRRQDYQASFVVCQGWCVRGLLEIYKLEIFDTNCGLVSDARGRLNLYWIEMKLQYMYSALDLWPLGFFASRIGRSEMKCSALEFSYVRWPITRLIFPMYRRWIAHFMETLEQLIDQTSELSYFEWRVRGDISLLRLQSFQEVDDHFLNWKVFRCQRLKNLIATQVNGIWRLVYFIFLSRLLPLL